MTEDRLKEIESALNAEVGHGQTENSLQAASMVRELIAEVRLWRARWKSWADERDFTPHHDGPTNPS